MGSMIAKIDVVRIWEDLAMTAKMLARGSTHAVCRKKYQQSQLGS